MVAQGFLAQLRGPDPPGPVATNPIFLPKFKKKKKKEKKLRTFWSIGDGERDRHPGRTFLDPRIKDVLVLDQVRCMC